MKVSASDSPQSLPVLLQQRAEGVPDRVFLRDVHGTSLTYGETWAAVLHWAGALEAAGVNPGDRVATLVDNSVPSVVVWLAISVLGATEVPIHQAFKGYMLEHVITLTGCTTAVADEGRVAHLEPSLGRVPIRRVIGVKDGLLATATPAAPSQLPMPWDTAAIIGTSGTTGPSKGVVVPWGAIRATAQRTFPYDDLDANDVFYMFTPAAHMGAKAIPYLAAMLGGSVLMRPDFKIGEFVNDVRTYGITTAPAVGAIPRFLEQSPPQPDDHDLPLRNVVMAPLVEDLDGFKRRFGVRICTAYNMTELAIPFASDGWTTHNWRSVGRLQGGWPGIEVRLVDDHDIEVPTGDVGELIVRASQPWTMNIGYDNMPEATAAAWRNGWFHTGDAFRRDGDGYYYFVDRIKDAIRRRGENVSSFEVETLVNTHPSVSESAAVAARDGHGDEEVHVFVVPVADHGLDPEELIEFLDPVMPRFMIPRYIDIVRSLPKTPGTMRTIKKDLRERGVTTSTWDRLAAGIELPR